MSALTGRRIIIAPFPYNEIMKSSQKIVVFGASGRVGSLVVKYALDAGYDVVAFVHRHHQLPDNPALTIIQGDIYVTEDVLNAIKGVDIVVSALGSWGTKRKDVLSSAMASIIPAMQQHGVTRIVSLTGAEARASGDHLGIIHRFAHVGIGMTAGKILRDGERHIEALEQSRLDWTVIRSPIMTSRPVQKYTLSNHRPTPWALIQRTAVARAMVDQLSDETYIRQAPFIHRSR